MKSFDIDERDLNLLVEHLKNSKIRFDSCGNNFMSEVMSRILMKFCPENSSSEKDIFEWDEPDVD